MAESYFVHNLVLFGRLLSSLGLEIDLGKMTSAGRALEEIDLRSRADLFYALRCLLVQDHKDYLRFKQAFDLFWRKHPKGWKAMSGINPQRQKTQNGNSNVSDLTAENLAEEEAGNLKDLPEVFSALSYSSTEILRYKDFAELTPDEEREVTQLIRKIDWDPYLKRSRRWQSGGEARLNLRKTLRENLRFGGETLILRKRTHRYKARPVVILADVSGSMEPYSRVLLQFIYSMTAGLSQKVESFLFSTRLTHITRQIDHGSVNQAVRAVSGEVPDWSGGTRIGDILRSFNRDWARRVSSHNAVLLIISDGWDRGEPGVLKREIAHLKRSCYRLVWLNPLLGSPEYQPLTRGMQAALPHIDQFLPVHNLVSLEDLVKTFRSNSKTKQSIKRLAYA